MMRIPKMYIETSVFNFVFTDDSPEKREDALTLFEEIRQGRFQPYTSNYVTQELIRAPEPKREQMLNLLRLYDVTILAVDSQARRLAEVYVEEGIIPFKYLTDAQHIATATVNDMDLIVSYNFKHIVKWKTITRTEVVNLREGYKRVGICSPTEVIDNED